MRLNKAKTEINIRPIPEIMASVLRNDAELTELVYLGQIIQEFKKSVAFEILCTDTVQSIQMVLAVGRGTEAVSAEYVLGKLEGRQGFLEGVEKIIEGGKNAELELKRQREAIQEVPEVDSL